MTEKLMIPMMVALAFLATGCEQDGPAERAGEAVDEAAENIQDAGRDIGDEIEDAADEVEDAANDPR